VTATQEIARWLLPAEAYRSSAWYITEQQRLFGRCWNFVGTLDDFAGDTTLVATVAGVASAIQLEAGVLTGWHATGPVAVEHWCGLVFAHLEPATAPPLADWLGEFPECIGGFQPDRLVEVARYQFELGANWKFFVENHIDVYHLWYLHAQSLGAYDHARAQWAMTGQHWVFYEPPRQVVDTDDDGFWRGLLPVSHVDRDRWGSGAHLIFPNLTLATGAGFFMTYQCIPTGPERSVVDMRVRAEPGSDATAMLELSRTIIEREDGAACEGLQAAVQSPWFEVGPLARHHELPITRFHELVLAWTS
jgi:phenylpropionate dioxygenase-like ring-hydroxylating dioxygenase large terminal subunit